jgi:hypothetical protein
VPAAGLIGVRGLQGATARVSMSAGSPHEAAGEPAGEVCTVKVSLGEGCDGPTTDRLGAGGARMVERAVGRGNCCLPVCTRPWEARRSRGGMAGVDVGCSQVRVPRLAPARAPAALRHVLCMRVRARRRPSEVSR